jgi:glycosyltransferase involved in cell wall biosynthesis
MLIVIPAYNEAASILRVITGIRERHPDVSICVVNDCSSDETREKLLGLADPNLVVLPHPVRQGYGVAIQTGYKYALRQGFDFVLQMDADGQHDPQFIKEFLFCAALGRAHVIIGSRFLKGDGMPGVFALKRWAIRFFRVLIKLITGEKITDPTSGYQLLSRPALRCYVSDFFPVDFPDANLICWASRLGLRFEEIPVVMRERTAGTGMHDRLHRNLYYMYKVTYLSLLSIFVRPGGEP